MTWVPFSTFNIFLHQFVALALRSQVARTNNGFLVIITGRTSSKLSKNMLYSSCVWLGDLDNETIYPFLFWMQTSKIIHSFKLFNFTWHVIKNYLKQKPTPPLSLLSGLSVLASFYPFRRSVYVSSPLDMSQKKKSHLCFIL